VVGVPATPRSLETATPPPAATWAPEDQGEQLDRDTGRPVQHDRDDGDLIGLISPQPGAGLAAAIAYWAAHYGVSAADLTAIAICESTFGTNPDAYNGVSGHWTAFQFEIGTWYGSPPGQRGIDPWDATHWDAAEAAAYKLSIGERWRWPNC